nr:hypothetical protein [uncultured Porphyromonas sp.]
MRCKDSENATKPVITRGWRRILLHEARASEVGASESIDLAKFPRE